MKNEIPDVTSTKPKLFARYTGDKYESFQDWRGSTEIGRKVYLLFVEKAREYKQFHRRCSATLICNVIRWTMDVDATCRHGYKVPNNYIPMLARQLETDHPGEFGGLFTIERNV